MGLEVVYSNQVGKWQLVISGTRTCAIVSLPIHNSHCYVFFIGILQNACTGLHHKRCSNSCESVRRWLWFCADKQGWRVVRFKAIIMERWKPPVLAEVGWRVVSAEGAAAISSQQKTYFGSLLWMPTTSSHVAGADTQANGASKQTPSTLHTSTDCIISGRRLRCL